MFIICIYKELSSCGKPSLPGMHCVYELVLMLLREGPEQHVYIGRSCIRYVYIYLIYIYTYRTYSYITFIMCIYSIYQVCALV